MAGFIKKISKTAGHLPGELIHIGENTGKKVKVSVMDYDPDAFREKTDINIDEALSFKDNNSITWINVDGLHELGIIEKIGNKFGLHSLTLEDIVNTGQRPKFEDFESYIFIVLKMVMFDDKNKEITAEQVSFILGEDFVVSFQEKEGDVFDPIRERIRKAKGRVRKMKADYLAYSLIDAVIDNYFSILEKLDDKIEIIEETLISNPEPNTLGDIYKLKRDIIFLKKSIWPLREAVNSLERTESDIISENMGVFFRDIYDHTIQAIDTVETFRDMVSGMLDIYLSSISNRMNEIMKVLTIFAAIFIPLTFIAGIYGMNFEFIPELKWKWGYFMALSIMFLLGTGMLFYFRKKKWI
ncbi:MAG: magnesium/cobalt transporter CorA [Candidatus Omnitrophica bacterium]|nr:magnesium/cobalt transporter CorA [Candidatus Omnitrophota bacterium]MDD5441209.1 magnesium/cobalt transporter CorA [Candidatus Omnitrophota bacterium]